jgi:serine/threonine protein kinase
LTQGDPRTAAGVHEGQILAGKYRVEKLLGVGGMGLVVAATHVHLDTKVALKFLLPTMLGNPDVVGRFAREARAAVRIQSEHVARVSDVGTLENGAPYMVMEFLEGSDLAAWLVREGPLPIEQAVDFALQACVGIASAHALGIVHRDLKPGNLFCLRGNDGQFVIKVLDFGISKVTDLGGSPEGMSGTRTATVMGSPFYMSPEQMVSAKDVDAQTDIWSLGVVLYELLTATRPFVGESLPEIAIKVAMASFAPVRSLRPDAPPGLDAVILKCLEKDKTRRYGNVAALALALADFSSKRSRPLVEKIVAIVEASGIGRSAATPAASHSGAEAPGVGTVTALTPEPIASPTLGSMARSAPTADGGSGGRRRWTALAVAGTIGILGAIAAIGWKSRQPLAEGQIVDGGGAFHPSVAAAVSDETEACASSSTRCTGTTPATCKDGHWVNGTVTADRCGAACTPGSSAPQCNGETPQTCGSAGQWENGTPCPYACNQGGCVGVCVPGKAQCSGVKIQTCGADGEWESPTPCPGSRSCQSGLCAAVKAVSDHCDPSYTLDDQGRKHFKPECFLKK